MEVAVVGGGLVGMATALDLVHRGLEVTVFEAAPRLGSGQSGHNSNVIHSGAFYMPGSLKARLATEGRERLEAFVSEHRLPLQRIGKLVIRLPGERERFDELVRRASANGVPAEVLGSAAALRAFEPLVTGDGALWLPLVAVTDFVAVLDALADEVRVAGGEVRMGEEVRLEAGRLLANGRLIDARHVVVAAGVGMNRLTAEDGWGIVGFEGAYRELLSPLQRRLIYGVPDPRYPFLGVHVTPDVFGRATVGPTASLHPPILLARTARLVAHNLGVVPRELATWALPSVMRRRVRRYVPGAMIGREVVKAGVRAQAVDVHGNWADDFVFIGRPGLTFVANAPSPGATACLSIGSHIADRVVGALRG